MEIILGTVVIAVAMLAMSIGVIFNNKPLKGSCGGQDGICPVCGDKTNKCESNEYLQSPHNT